MHFRYLLQNKVGRTQTASKHAQTSARTTAVDFIFRVASVAGAAEKSALSLYSTRAASRGEIKTLTDAS